MQMVAEYRLAWREPDCRSGLIGINEFPKFCRIPGRGAGCRAVLTFGPRLSFCAIPLRLESRLGGSR
jgi:hypothetical protein